MRAPLGALVWPLVAAACAAPAPEGTRVVVGLQSSLGISQLEVKATSDGAPLAGSGVRSAPMGSLGFPLELPFADLAPQAELDVQLFSYDDTFAAPLVARRLVMEVPASGDWLVRVRLERECVPSAQLAGGATAPECVEPLTCVAATCVDPHLEASALEPYRADWDVDYADACKPDGSAPVLEVGLGETAFESIPDGGDVPLNLGEQGGYHIWLSLRAFGLHKSGSVTTVHLVAEDGSIDLGEAAWSYALSPGGGACELVGLKFITPPEYWSLSGVQAMVDLPVRLEAKIVDERGDVGLSVVHGVLR